MQITSFLEGDTLKHLFLGLVVGVIGTCIIGFGWGGWHLNSTVEEKVKMASQEAKVAALAPICAKNFERAAGADKNVIAEFKAVNSWQRDNYVKKAGWATFPGTAEADNLVAEACAQLVLKKISPAT